MGLYEEKRLFNRGDQPDDIFLTLIEYQNKEEISSEEKADFLKRMENVEQLCIGGGLLSLSARISSILRTGISIEKLEILRHVVFESK